MIGWFKTLLYAVAMLGIIWGRGFIISWPNSIAHANSIYVMNQYDYPDINYGNSGTVADAGCGLCAIINAVYYMNGNLIDLIELRDYSVANDFRVYGSGTAWGLSQSFADARGAAYGFKCNGYKTFDSMKTGLQNGNVFVTSWGHKDGSGGHYMAVVDYNAHDDTYLILDSAGPNNGWSHHTYSWQRIYISNDRYVLSEGDARIARDGFDCIIELAPTEIPLANLGEDFYGLILNKACWKPISEKEGTDNIYLESEDGSSRQVWRFQRQGDGAYVISSCYDGHILEMTSGNREVCTQITASSNNFWGGAYQQWYLYKCGDGYIIQSKHYTSEEWVMDLYGAFSDDDNIIQINNRNNSTAQIWAIYSSEDVQLRGPDLTVTPGDSNTPTKFSWSRSYGVTSYNVRIFKDALYSDEEYTMWGIDGNSTCECETVLPAGKYVVYVDAVNYYYCKGSDIDIWFVVTQNHDTPIFGTTDFILPSELAVIDESAFEGITATAIYISDACTSIGKWAFLNCPKLTQIRIPANCTIGTDAFEGCLNVVIFGTPGSAAETYANSHANCSFVAE